MVSWPRRPRAQSRNPDSRRAALRSDPLEELGRPLAEFAREDDDAGVRKAALRRAADIELARECMRDDADDGVRELAAKLYRQLLSGEHPEAPALAARQARLANIHERALLEHLACHGAETALRESALRKLDRPEFTLQRLLKDPDRELRLRLLAEIDDPAVLERIADKTHRRDKQLHQRARTRLRQLHIAAGDAEAIHAEAQQLCRELESLPGDKDRAATTAAIDLRWQAVRDQTDPVLATRYANARAQCLAAADAPERPPSPADAPAPEEAARKLPRMHEPRHPSGRVQPSSADVQQIEAQSRFEASVAATGSAREEPESKAHKPKRKTAPTLEPLLDALDQALDAGHLADADRPVRQIRSRQKQLTRPQLRRWQRLHARFAELQRWQQWSTRRQRRQLCVEARGMRASELHPEAIANRIRDLRQAWQRLDELEPAEAQSNAVNQSLKRRFHGLCHRALAPTRPWFEARDKARNEQTQKIETLLQQPLPDDDFKAMARRRQQLVSAKRDLGKVEPRRRKVLARSLSKAIGAIDEPLREHQDEVATAHDRLIAKAEQLKQREPRERPAAARQLQAEWQTLGPGQRNRDRKQWRAFRAAVDQVFAEREQQHKARAEQRQQAQAQAGQLLEQLQQQATTEDDPARLRALLRDARAEWRQLDIRDKSLATRLDKLRTDIETRAADADTDARRQRYRDWLASALAGESAQDMPAGLRQAARERPEAPGERDTARKLLVRLETLAAIDSPPEDHELRMQAKLERLQSSLGAGRRESVEAQLDELLGAWIRLGWSREHDAALDTRFHTAADAALTRIH